MTVSGDIHKSATCRRAGLPRCAAAPLSDVQRMVGRKRDPVGTAARTGLAPRRGGDVGEPRLVVEGPQRAGREDRRNVGPTGGTARAGPPAARAPWGHGTPRPAGREWITDAIGAERIRTEIADVLRERGGGAADREQEKQNGQDGPAQRAADSRHPPEATAGDDRSHRHKSPAFRSDSSRRPAPHRGCGAAHCPAPARPRWADRFPAY